MTVSLIQLIRRWSIETSSGRGLRKVLHAWRYHYARWRGAEPNVDAFDSREFYLRDAGKRDAYLGRRLYMPDEGAAVCYACGVRYLDEPQAFTGATFREQVDAIRLRQARLPKRVINVGCGLGMVDAALSYAGIECIGIDPSPGAHQGYTRTFEDWLGRPGGVFLNARAHEGLAQIAATHGAPDTILMVECIEHIPAAEFEQFWALAVPILRETQGRFVITNGTADGEFPTIVDGTGWCHIREINDALYDQLSLAARAVIVRHRSHLVLQF